MTEPDRDLVQINNRPQRILVTGGAGFIGSNLVDRLLADGHEVTVFDNLSTGRTEFLETALSNSRCHVLYADLLDMAAVEAAVHGQELVFHLAANADVRHGTEHPRKDFEQNTVATHNMLEAMRQAGVRRIVFSSTGSVYGEPDIHPTPETCPFPVQTSLYGASKCAAEGLIAAYTAGFDMQAIIFRFVSILGPRYSHGHVFDFMKKLRRDPQRIEVLGDGRQRKSYLHVTDCVGAMLTALSSASEPLNVYNLGTDEYWTVDQSLSWICGELGVAPHRSYTGGQRGWIGDSPFIFLDCARIRALGWKPTYGIRSAVQDTLNYLLAHTWLLDERL